MLAKEAVLAVTYRCNAKCSMCNIWKHKDYTEIAPDEYAKLPRSLNTINITGGEPFLRSDLVEVVKALSENTPRARMVFSTNGYLTDRIVSVMDEIRSFHPKAGVGISIDGRAEVHDRVRGVSGMFKNALSTIEALKVSGFTDLRIGMTIVPENVAEIPHVFAISGDMGVEFTVTVAHNSEIYFGKTDNIGLESRINIAEPLMTVAQAQLKGKSVKNWFRAYHTSGIFDPSLRRGIETHCRAGRDYFFMAPDGNVYPCNVLNHRIGNVTEASKWMELFTPQAKKSCRAAVRNCRNDCWMVCNTRTLMKTHPLRVCTWVLKSKLKNQPAISENLDR